MEVIGRGFMVSACAVYINEVRKVKVTEVAGSLGINHTTFSKWKNYDAQTKVQMVSYQRLLRYLEDLVQKDVCEEEFLDFLLERLKKQGYDEARCSEILHAKGKNFHDRLTNLETDYTTHTIALQRQLDIADVFSHFRRYCQEYSDYFSVLNNSSISVNNYTKPVLQSWLYFPGNPETREQNYVIVSFPGNYRLAVILSNHNFDQYHTNIYFIPTIQEIMKASNLQMLLIYTDHNVSGELRHAFHTGFNGFFVNINSDKFHTEYFQYMMDTSSDYMISRQKAGCYAHYMFRKFLALFPMIKDEIVFHAYLNNPGMVSRQIDVDSHLLQHLAEHLVRDVYQYGYLTRHTIYFERQLVADQTEIWLKKYKRRSLGTVVELNFASAMISSAIESKCDKIMLVDWSREAVEYAKRKFAGTLGRGEKYEVHLADRHMDTISERTQKILLREKANLVIVSMGNGSNSSSIVHFLRHINEWLSPNGMLYMSFVNCESVLFQRQNNWLTRMDLSSRGKNHVLSLPPTSSLPEGLSLPMPTIRYYMNDVDRILSSYYQMDKTMTYPFLSASISPELSSRPILDEIRKIDKKHAEEEKYGHLIMAFGTRQPLSRQEKFDPAEIQKRILEFLDKLHMEYQLFDHEPATSKEQLMQAIHAARSKRERQKAEKKLDLQMQKSEKKQDFTSQKGEKKQDFQAQKGEKKQDYPVQSTEGGAAHGFTPTGQYQILKTVILQNRTTGEYQFHVLPVGQRIVYDRTSYTLVPERKITRLYGAGIISPLVTLQSVTKYTGCSGDLIVDKNNIAKRDYVLFSSGINTTSIWMKSADLLRLL